MGDRGFIALTDMLTRNSVLAELRVSGTGVGPAGGDAFVDMLLTNSTLRAADLWGAVAPLQQHCRGQ